MLYSPICNLLQTFQNGMGRIAGSTPLGSEAAEEVFRSIVRACRSIQEAESPEEGS